MLGELDRVAALEAWWVTAALAVAGDVDRWQAAAERRAAALVASVRAVPDLDPEAVGRALRAELERVLTRRR